MTGKRQRSLYGRTVHGLERAIKYQLERAAVLPFTVSGLAVFAYGGPPAYRQPGPTISLTVDGKVYTATRIVRRTVEWVVDLRLDETATDLLAPLLAAVRRRMGREDLDVRAAIDLACYLIANGTQDGAAPRAA